MRKPVMIVTPDSVRGKPIVGSFRSPEEAEEILSLAGWRFVYQETPREHIFRLTWHPIVHNLSRDRKKIMEEIEREF